MADNNGHTQDGTGGALTQHQRLARLFRGLTRAYGVYDLTKGGKGKKNKIEGRGHTERNDLTPEHWERHLAGVQGLGIIPITDDATCYFGAIDIDQYDLDHAEIEQRCASFGLPLLPTRTKSGGLHLYVFGLEPLPAMLLRQRLAEWAMALGFGGVEIFPKQDALHSPSDVGNWINMPYFNANATERYGILNGQRLNLEDFCRRAEQISITVEQLDALAPKDAPDDDFKEAPPCLQTIARTGFGSGMRNAGLFGVGVYLRKRYPDDWKQKIIEYNTKYMQPPLPQGEVTTITKSVNRKTYFYSCNTAPCANYCNKTLCRKREFGIGDKSTDNWGIVIDNDVQKVETIPPYWIMTANGVRLVLRSEEIIQQRRFQEVCIQKLGFLPPMLTAEKWRTQVNTWLAAAVKIEAPKDSSAGGELAFHLEQFCSAYAQAESREEILVGKPFTEEGVTYFRAADFKKYLDTQHFRALQGPRLYEELRAMGLGHKQFNVGKKNMLVWYVKAYETTEDVKMPVRHLSKEGLM